MRRAPPPPRTEATAVRCAIYTRKSSEEGLEQEFNSLDAQREAAEAYIASQRHEGWVAIPTHYDDGGFSGGTIERPALQRLLEAIERGKVDCLVVYKVDRFSRSLLDFTRLMEILDRHGVSFVSVTQQFNTTSSMGRLTLNILLSFAQFEREIIGERIRDKIAAARKKGKYTGGHPILGYDIDHQAKRLIVNPSEAALVRHIFQRICQLGSPRLLAEELNQNGYRTKAWVSSTGRHRGGVPWNKFHLYRVLNNRKYVGQIEHQGVYYPGEHEAIVSMPLFERATRLLEQNLVDRRNARHKVAALLRGVIRCGPCARSMTVSWTPGRGNKTGTVYRYYVCGKATKQGYALCPVGPLAAGEIEGAVIEQLRSAFRSPELVARTYRETREREAAEIERLRFAREDLERRLEATERKGEPNEIADLRQKLDATQVDLRELEAVHSTEREVKEALERLDPIWDELFPAEQTRIVQLLVERVEVSTDGVEVRMRGDGLGMLVREIARNQDPDRNGKERE